MSEGTTCYERDEAFCEDQMCLRTGCRIRNERLSPTPSAQTVTAENLKDAEDFCKGAFGPFVSDTAQYAEIVALAFQQVSDRATARLTSSLAAADARGKRLEEALRPFAEIPLWRDAYPDAKADTLMQRPLQGYVTVESVRAARSALSQTEEGR